MSDSGGLWLVTGSADTLAVPPELAGLAALAGSVSVATVRAIPPFLLLDGISGRIGGEAAALALARKVTDPLGIAGTRLAAEPSGSRDALADALDAAAHAMAGDSGDAEHDALASLAREAAAYAGLDWDAIRDAEQEGES